MESMTVDAKAFDEVELPTLEDGYKNFALSLINLMSLLHLISCTSITAHRWTVPRSSLGKVLMIK